MSLKDSQTNKERKFVFVKLYDKDLPSEIKAMLLKETADGTSNLNKEKLR